MAGYFLSTANFGTFMAKLISEAEVYAPVMVEDRPRLKKIGISNIGSIELGSYRTSEPIKSLILKAKENISAYFNGQNDIKTGKKVIFCKSCDIAALEFEDRFFGEEINDPFYDAQRKNALIIGSDCGDAIPSCHCTLVGVKPYPERYFDVNLSKMVEGYYVEAGSDEGRALIEASNDLFQPATATHNDIVAGGRQDMLNKVLKMNNNFNYKAQIEQITKIGLESEAWQGIAKNCVECGACNMVCPTCTCFVLYDERSGDACVRGREWDSCMKCGYARVAGGANTRPLLFRRTQNRWQCKFDYMYDKYGVYACSGCGRCTEVCMAKIDLRQALLDIEKQAALGLRLE